MRYFILVLSLIVLITAQSSTAQAISQREKCVAYVNMMDTFLQVARASVDAGVNVYTKDKIASLEQYPNLADAAFAKRKYGDCVIHYRKFYAEVAPADRRTLRVMERDSLTQDRK